MLRLGLGGDDVLARSERLELVLRGDVAGGGGTPAAGDRGEREDRGAAGEEDDQREADPHELAGAAGDLVTLRGAERPDAEPAVGREAVPADALQKIS